MSDNLWAMVLNALFLLFSGDKALWEIIAVSLRVSLFAILISTPIALVLAFLLSNCHCYFTKIALSITHTLVAVPAVVVGLVIYLLLSKYGVLGDLYWLFSQKAMILGQILLAFPIILNVSYSGLNSISKQAEETAVTFGAKRWQVALILMFECRFTLITAITMAFGRIIAEVGSAMMIGGNILHHTRNITTAIALETSKGEFSQAIALGIVLVILALTLNLFIMFFNKKTSL
ncbi:Tungstate ABC transporter, permease protein [uncultured Gammaproteobacteria bacterium]|jgi:tungstate transport system permease protein|uniref:Tungstate ABC transporter, permease protein n=1 Tax=Bathymodiolus azoricus thioautotrophic gill symbiont TaxID=235205 RepID=A0ACA8ZTG8_9GAMM|nr:MULTISPECIES: ABC transporter permease [Gammaproteobacteria]CAC9431531.1 Tungstate ABC transporter, permease protein [uncultured Gammaproteobacteria bacterium]CAB5507547.1 Tungstate ABC transporter, permease protein [Bathymodiolus azoricus thioautotrophic gill symbiont]CAC9491701.1 Tungstate ABC transporter, permease protein [uncultured Gammaproteobacteria bacterium]CAC9493128.1 Tungstate ABC transporter, permease protein [uncultured Gammaproteobacteria bacterium]CAC9496209.1 Tungstate ABC 